MGAKAIDQMQRARETWGEMGTPDPSRPPLADDGADELHPAGARFRAAPEILVGHSSARRFVTNPDATA